MEQKLEFERKLQEQIAQQNERRREAAYMDAQRRYERASIRYRDYAKQGLMQNALNAQQEMEAAKAEMMRYR